MHVCHQRFARTRRTSTAPNPDDDDNATHAALHAQLFSGPTLSSPLAISVIWAVYAAIPPFLVCFYAFVSRGGLLQWVCRAAMLLSTFCSIAAVALMCGAAAARAGGS